MHATPRVADERPLEMDSHDFGARRGWRAAVERAADVSGDVFEASASPVRGRRHRGGDQRSGAKSRYSPRHGFEGFRASFHHIMPAGSVNMHVHEARYNRAPCGVDKLRSGGQLYFFAPAHADNPAILDEDDCTCDFLEGSEDSAAFYCGISHARPHGT